ncbi:hypothetical protein GRO01_20430 [Gluconobacter roseus NBRC 3990]|uniref:Uncharacterized protein n=1 Tax=Gluconobacter roseus NBRC 3990 TaxID=1307950 RepID=A0A4Y3M7P0_9PROT|nr:hypothetical protein GRO01_20430 [Gluconobacter roseus NBRC 3990]
MTFGQAQDMMRDGRTAIRTSRVMQPGIENKGFRLLRSGNTFQCCQTGAIVKAWNADGPKAKRFEGREEVAVTGIFYKYSVSWLGQTSDAQFQSLTGAMREDESRQVTSDALSQQEQADQLPEAGMTIRIAIP